MLVWKNKTPGRVYYKGHRIEEIHTADRKVFEMTFGGSCFGRGFWIDENPWIDEDVWVD